MNLCSLILVLGLFEETTVLFVHETGADQTSNLWSWNREPHFSCMWTLVQYGLYASLGICECAAACQLLTLRHRSQAFIYFICIATWLFPCCFACSSYWAASVHKPVWFEDQKNIGVASQHEGPISFVTQNAGLSTLCFGLILLQTQWKCGLFQNSWLSQRMENSGPCGSLNVYKRS